MTHIRKSVAALVFLILVLSGSETAKAAAPQGIFTNGTPKWSFSPVLGWYVYSKGFLDVPVGASPLAVSGQWSEDAGRTVKGSVAAQWAAPWLNQNGVAVPDRYGFTFSVNPTSNRNVRVRLIFSYQQGRNTLWHTTPWVSP